MTSGRQVVWFLAAAAAVLALMIAAFAGLNDLSRHYGWDGCKTVQFGDQTQRVCDS